MDPQKQDCIVSHRAGGIGRLVKALAEDVPVLYNTGVSGVHYGPEGVTVVTKSGQAIAADACVFTVPLGVLKAEHISFDPPLPKPKLAAIRRLGCA
jgi:polyamine oxidase